MSNESSRLPAGVRPLPAHAVERGEVLVLGGLPVGRDVEELYRAAEAAPARLWSAGWHAIIAAGLRDLRVPHDAAEVHAVAALLDRLSPEVVKGLVERMMRAEGDAAALSPFP